MDQMIKITLKAARINKGMLQSEVAEKLETTEQTIVSWESGKSEPKISQALKLSNLYGIPIDNLIFVQE